MSPRPPESPAQEHSSKGRLEERRMQGLPLVGGIAVGRPFYWRVLSSLQPIQSHSTAGPAPVRQAFRIDDEMRRFRSAIDRSLHDVQAIQSQLHQEGVPEGAEILDAHLMMLRDPMITNYIEDRIRSSQETLESVIHGFIRDCQRKFDRIADDAFRMRLGDIQDVINRILGHLATPDVRKSIAQIPPGAILFTKEASPSQMAEAQRLMHAGCVTLMGGDTSHATIIARARGLPFVANVAVEPEELDGVDTAIVDGYTGTVILNPASETLAWFTTRAAELRRLMEEISALRHLPACTRDGTEVQVQGSIKLLDELGELSDKGCHGIGLYRSEMLLEGKEGIALDEEIQVEAYCQALRVGQDDGCVVRVWDIGGDKTFGLTVERSLAYEHNPFLGCRGVRLLLRHPELLQTQLRALWRASLYGRLQVLVPMVSSLEEILAFKEHIAHARAELVEEGSLLPPQLELGVMIETPAAALMASSWIHHVDFLSIGTNDLVQYTLAAERGNASVAHLYSPLHPAHLRLLHHLAQTAGGAGVPLSLCGEMASDPAAVPLLMGLGIRKLAVSPHQAPRIKHTVRSITLEAAEQLAAAVLQMQTTEEIRSHLDAFLQQHCPVISMLR